MIKIGHLLANELRQVAGLLAMQDDVALSDWETSDTDLLLQSMNFWQHWVPYQMHVGPSVYVAREDGRVLGVICLHHMSKSRGCWQIDSLIVHPDHRGRGIAQELLRFVFAQFGSQGVSHFMAEVPAANDAALALFASCGFCRSSLITMSRFNRAYVRSWSKVDHFRVALPHMRQQLYQLYSEALPPAIRQVLLLGPEDFVIREPVPFTSVEVSRQKLMRNRVWYYVSEDSDRRVLTAAAKVTARPQNGYRLEFAVHPGWKHLAEDLICFTLEKLLQDAPHLPVWAKVYDFQPEVQEVLNQHGFERTGESFLLCREHWVRARQPRKQLTAKPIPLTNTAINFPLATDRRAET